MVKDAKPKTWNLWRGNRDRRRQSTEAKPNAAEIDDTPLDAIFHPDLRDANSDDLDDLFLLVRYVETGDKKLLKPLTLERLDVLFARYGAMSKPHVRALTIHRDELRDERTAKLSRREKVGIAILSMLLGTLGGLLSRLLDL